MNSYDVTIIYARPCRFGGIQSHTTSVIANGESEEQAIEWGKIHANYHKDYLYLILAEAQLRPNPALMANFLDNIHPKR